MKTAIHNLRFTYKDFLALMHIDDPDMWDPRLKITMTAVFMKEPPPELLPSESDQSWLVHPTGNYEEPVLKFPCSGADFIEACDALNLSPSIEPFHMASLVAEKLLLSRVDDASIGNSESSYVRAARMVEVKFYSNVSWDDPGTYPNPDAVTQHLLQSGFTKTAAKKIKSFVEAGRVKRGRPEKN